MPEDMSEQAQEIYNMVIEMAVTYGMSMLFAIVILIIGFWFATRAKNIVIRAMRKSKKIDETIIIFAGSMVRYLVIIFTVLAVLDQFGVERAADSTPGTGKADTKSISLKVLNAIHSK